MITLARGGTVAPHPISLTSVVRQFVRPSVSVAPWLVVIIHRGTCVVGDTFEILSVHTHTSQYLISVTFINEGKLALSSISISPSSGAVRDS